MLRSGRLCREAPAQQPAMLYAAHAPCYTLPASSRFGGGHQPNEGMCIELLTNMVEIYANALLAIDQLPL